MNALETIIKANVQRLTGTELQRLCKALQPIFDDARRFKVIEKACGYVGNGSSEMVKLHQDDATYSWHMEAGRMSAYAEPGDLSLVIDKFETKYKDVLE